MPALLKKLSPETARIQTLFHRHVAGADFAIGGAGWRVEPYVGDAGRRHGVAIYGTLGDGEFTVWLDDPDWRVAVAAVLQVPPDGVTALPERIQQAALECYADAIVTAVEKGTGLPVTITKLERKELKPLVSACAFRLVGPNGLGLGGAWLLTGGTGARCG